MAEHWLYVPSAAFFVLVAWVIRKDYKIYALKWISGIVCVGVLGVNSYLTIAHNKAYWMNPEDFFKNTLIYAPDSSRVYNLLGVLYCEKDDYDAAVEMFQQAIEKCPDKPAKADAYNNLAIIYYRQRKYSEAVAIFKKAVEINPYYAEGYKNLIKACCAQRRYKEAMYYYNHAKQYNIEIPEAVARQIRQ